MFGATLPSCRANCAAAWSFFQAALRKKVIVVPGEFFDVNPGKRRPGHATRFRSYARFPLALPCRLCKRGLARLGELIDEYR